MGTLLSTIFGKTWLTLGLVAVIAVAVAIVARNVRIMTTPPKPPHSESFVVADVPNGSTISVKVGIRDRQTRTVTLQHISTPDAGDSHFVAAVANLKKLAGDTIRVETTSRGRLFGEAPDSKEQPVDATEPEVHGPNTGREMSDEEFDAMRANLEGRGPILGVAYGQFGACLNLAQIMDGYASCLPSAPKEWKRQEAIAKKAKRGIWSNKNGK
jgi:hypothetical protein